MISCRLEGRVPRKCTINADAAKVLYQASESDVKIYAEAASNGVQKNNKDYNKVNRLFEKNIFKTELHFCAAFTVSCLVVLLKCNHFRLLAAQCINR